MLAAENTPGWADFQQRIFEAWSSLSGMPALPKPHWCGTWGRMLCYFCLASARALKRHCTMAGQAPELRMTLHVSHAPLRKLQHVQTPSPDSAQRWHVLLGPPQRQ